MANKNAAICTTVADFFATYRDAAVFADACEAYVRDFLYLYILVS